MKTITVTITSAGPVVEADGFHGPACEQLLDRLLKDTGLVVTHQERKPEYHQSEMQPVVQG